MTNAQLFQQMALLRWLSSQSDSDRESLIFLNGVQVARELFNRVTGQDQIEQYKRECIQNIALFVQQNPTASETQINTEVEKHVLLFAARVKALDSAPLF